MALAPPHTSRRPTPADRTGRGSSPTTAHPKNPADETGIDFVADGTYAVTPSSGCYTFSPARTDVTLFGVNTASINFAAMKAWTSGTPPGNVWWRSVTYGNGMFVAIAQMDASYNATAAAARSTDGVHWTFATIPPSEPDSYRPEPPAPAAQ